MFKFGIQFSTHFDGMIFPSYQPTGMTHPHEPTCVLNAGINFHSTFHIMALLELSHLKSEKICTDINLNGNQNVIIIASRIYIPYLKIFANVLSTSTCKCRHYKILCCHNYV